MKRNILLLISCLVLNNVNANSDSLNCISDSNFCIETIDSNLIQEDNLATIEGTANKIKLKIENKKINLTKPANWFTDAWDWFTDLFKPVHGLYKEDGYRNEGPYFLFDRIYDGGATYTRIQMQRNNKI
jgi:hypothetical protein